MAYLPYGGVRLGDASTLPTDYTFTGQRLEAGLGLMHYGARFYSPRLGRFVSADTIVPEHGDRQAAQWPLRVGVFKPQDIARVGEENRQIAQYGFWFQRVPGARQDTVRPTGPTNPQELNRYAYCLGNPLRYVDPGGEQTEVIVAVVAFVVIFVLLEPHVEVIIEDIREASSSDKKEGPLAAPESSPAQTPGGIPQGGPPLLPSSTPRWGVPLLLPTPTPTGPWAVIRAAMPTPTPTPTATLSPGQENLLRLNGWMPPDEGTPPEDAYGNPLHGPVVNPWLPLDPLRQPWYSK